MSKSDGPEVTCDRCGNTAVDTGDISTGYSHVTLHGVTINDAAWDLCSNCTRDYQTAMSDFLATVVNPL